MIIKLLKEIHSVAHFLPIYLLANLLLGFALYLESFFLSFFVFKKSHQSTSKHLQRSLIKQACIIRILKKLLALTRDLFLIFDQPKSPRPPNMMTEIIFMTHSFSFTNMLHRVEIFFNTEIN